MILSKGFWGTLVLAAREQLKDRLQMYLQLTRNAEKFEESYELAKVNLEAARLGKGWDPDSVPLETYALRAIPASAAIEAGEATKTRLFALFGFLRKPKPDEVSLVSKRLHWYPFWSVEGIYWCFFFRKADYSVSVPGDVVAVYVGGQMVDVNLEERRGSTHFLPRALKRLEKENNRLSASEPKSVTFGEVVKEFAYRYNAATLYLDSRGLYSIGFHGLVAKKFPMFKISDEKELHIEGVDVDVQPFSESKAGVIRHLHDKIVTPPRSFRKVLENFFDVTKLQVVYVPVYILRFQRKDKIKELMLSGVTGNRIKSITET
jgi:hypothetical protein